MILSELRFFAQVGVDYQCKCAQFVSGFFWFFHVFGVVFSWWNCGSNLVLRRSEDARENPNPEGRCNVSIEQFSQIESAAKINDFVRGGELIFGVLELRIFRKISGRLPFLL